MLPIREGNCQRNLELRHAGLRRKADFGRSDRAMTTLVRGAFVSRELGTRTFRSKRVFDISLARQKGDDKSPLSKGLPHVATGTPDSHFHESQGEHLCRHDLRSLNKRRINGHAHTRTSRHLEHAIDTFQR